MTSFEKKDKRKDAEHFKWCLAIYWVRWPLKEFKTPTQRHAGVKTTGLYKLTSVPSFPRGPGGPGGPVGPRGPGLCDAKLHENQHICT